MGKVTGFLEIKRKDHGYQAVEDRTHNYQEFVIPLKEEESSNQAARCMDCGVPFCHEACPVNNIIPDWNDLTYKHDWEEALSVLHSTNNFPEFTGRVCPAPCEAACTLNLQESAVTIKDIEYAIVEKGWETKSIKPAITPDNNPFKTGKAVAIVGSGPAGMAAAQQLSRAGHSVTVFEKQQKIGGLLRFGIPDFKLEKSVVQRRVDQMQAEGVTFITETHIGVDKPAKELLEEFDAVVLTGGSEHPRDLPIEGRSSEGVEFAMDFLRSNTRRVQGLENNGDTFISAKDKHVVVIGGGDTGSDCIGTSVRHGAKSVTQLEILPQPPEKEDKLLVWPGWPNKFRTSTSQEEGCERLFSVATKSFIHNDEKLQAVKCIKVEWKKDAKGQWQMTEVDGSEFELKADLVTLAMGFVHPVHEGMLKELDVELDSLGNVKGAVDGNDAYHTSLDKVFAAGDMRRGQSLVVWAIREGRQCAHAVDTYLMGSSELPL